MQVPSMRGLETRADFLGKLRRDLLAEKARHVLGLHRQHRLAGKLFIKRLERRGGAKHKVDGILHLRQAPVIALIKGVHDRTAQLGEAIENPMQLFGRERIGEGLRPLPVVDAQKGVVGKGKADAGGGKLPCQPAVSVAIELQPEGTPGRHAQVTQADLSSSMKSK